MSMSASKLMAEYRAKKKKMKEEHSDAVKLSGIPEDATDMEVIKGMEPGERLSENEPPVRDEEPSLEQLEKEQTAAQPHLDEAPDPKQINQPEDGPVENRKAKLRKKMGMMKG